MNENLSGRDGKNKAMNAMIIGGVVIGLILAFILFLLTSPRQTKAPISQAVTSTRAPEVPILMATAKGKTTPTLTPVAFQYDQVRAAVGDPAPYFVLNDLNGKAVSLQDYTGQPVILNLWATWCKPCEYETPGFQKLYEKYKDDGLVVLGIDVAEKDDVKRVAEFVKTYGLTYPILLDGDSYVSSSRYGMNGLPMSFFIDSNGILRRIQAGAMLPDVLEKYTQEILPK